MKIASLLLAGLAVGFASCTSSSESANRDAMTANVGIYSPPPQGLVKVRVGVPAFQKNEKTTAEMADSAADELISLAVNTERFEVIERAQLDALLKEQSLEGIVKSGELAKPAEVRGVDYLILGKVTNFRIKAENTKSGFNLGSLPIPGTGGALGLFDINDQNSVISVDCGVDLRLVDPTTGTTVVANFSEYQRKDSLGAMGVSVLGANAKAGEDLHVDKDNQGKILRLALDDCMKKMLPKLDKALVARAKAAAPAAAPETPKAEAAPTADPSAAKKFCGNCGKPLKADAKFCAECGTKTGG